LFEEAPLSTNPEGARAVSVVSGIAIPNPLVVDDFLRKCTRKSVLQVILENFNV
jgi:hypothetical protein